MESKDFSIQFENIFKDAEDCVIILKKALFKLKEQTIPFIKNTKEKKGKKKNKDVDDEVEEEKEAAPDNEEAKEIIKEKGKWIESQEEKFFENT